MWRKVEETNQNIYSLSPLGNNTLSSNYHPSFLSPKQGTTPFPLHLYVTSSLRKTITGHVLRPKMGKGEETDGTLDSVISQRLSWRYKKEQRVLDQRWNSRCTFIHSPALTLQLVLV